LQQLVAILCLGKHTHGSDLRERKCSHLLFVK